MTRTLAERMGWPTPDPDFEHTPLRGNLTPEVDGAYELDLLPAKLRHVARSGEWSQMGKTKNPHT